MSASVFVDISDLNEDSTSDGLLGVSALGVARRGYWLGSPVSLKSLFFMKEEIALSGVSLKAEQVLELQTSLRKESQRVYQLRHPNLVSFYGLAMSNDKPRYIVAELMAVSVHSLLYSDSARMLSTPQRIKILHDVGVGLEFLHSCGFFHRGVKPTNIFLDARGQAKLGDIVGVRALTESLLQSTKYVGDAYSAPEIADEEEEETDKADVFSFGVMAAEVAVGRPPEPGPAIKKRRAVPEEERRAKDISAVPTGPIRDVVLHAVLDDPAARSNMAAIVLMLEGKSQAQSETGDQEVDPSDLPLPSANHKVDRTPPAETPTPQGGSKKKNKKNKKKKKAEAFSEQVQGYAKGTLVALKDLQGRADLNGRFGHVTGPETKDDKGAERIPVKIQGLPSSISVRTVNVDPAPIKDVRSLTFMVKAGPFKSPQELATLIEPVHLEDYGDPEKEIEEINSRFRVNVRQMAIFYDAAGSNKWYYYAYASDTIRVGPENVAGAAVSNVSLRGPMFVVMSGPTWVLDDPKFDLHLSLLDLVETLWWYSCGGGKGRVSAIIGRREETRASSSQCPALDALPQFYYTS